MLLRALIFALATTLIAGAQLRERKEPPPSHEGLVDEDEDLLPQTEYAFNPIQAKKDLKVGDFYAKKGNHRAAAARYLEATRWNPQYAEAFFKLGRSRDELDQPAQALDAFRRYLEIEPEGKQSRKVRERIEELAQAVEDQPPVAQNP